MNDSIYNHPELCCSVCFTKTYCSEMGNCKLDGMDIVGPGQHKTLYEIEQEERDKQIEHILYRVFDGKFRLLYVGITLDFAKRMSAHGKRDWWPQVEHITLERFESREELAAAEKRVIETEKPKFNVIHNRVEAQINRGYSL